MMKTRWLVVAALPLLAIPLAQAQGSERKAEVRADGSNGRLTRVAPRGEAQDDAERFDREGWKKKLSADNLQDREDAFDRLVEIASRNADAREALETWSKDEADAGLAWTSRLILRDVGQRPRRWLTSGSGPGWGLFGKELDLDGFAQRFDDLDSMFGDLRTQWDEMLNGLPNPSAGGQGMQSSESLSLQSGPDGVSCKVTEKVDGEEQTTEYKAKTIEELLDAHPELRQKIGGSGSLFWTHPNTPNRMRILRPRGLPETARPGIVHIDPHASAPGPDSQDSVPGNAADPRTDRLGIFCAPLEESEAAELGLESGVGLRVEDTQPGTIARILGLRSGDVVIEINGTAIHSADDVKEALRARRDRADGAGVSVVVAGAEGRRTLTWKPAVKKTDSQGERKSGEKSSEKSGQKSGGRNL